jgi:O-antigen ligase
VTFIAVARAVVAIGVIWIFAGSPRLPVLLLVTGVLLGGIGMTSFLWGADAWAGTMTARVSLWRDLAILLTKNLSVLVSGGGYPLFTREAHIQPADFHNRYLFVLLQYGVLGLLIFGVMGYRLVAMGWRALSRGSIRSQPMLVAMWAGMLGFLVSGLAESQVQEPYQRMAFVQAIVLYLWLCMDGMEQSPGLAVGGPLPQERSPDGSGHARV